MIIRGNTIVWGILLFTFSAFGERPAVQQTWVRKFPGLSLQIFSDNLGHIAAVGREVGPDETLTNEPVALLLNERGRVIARRTVPFGQVRVDQSGRFFFTWNAPDTHRVQCTAFAPLLRTVLWEQTKSVSNQFAPNSIVHLVDTVADEGGGNWALGSLSGDVNSGFFLVPFGTERSPLFWMMAPDHRVRQARQLVRAPNGTLHGICVTTTLSKYSQPTIMSYSPGAADLNIWILYSPSAGSHWPSAAASDRDSNLLIVGTYVENVWTHPREAIVHRRSADGSVDWIQTSFSNSAHLVVTDLSRNVIVSTIRGLVKYSPDGLKLWDLPTAGTSHRLDERLLVEAMAATLFSLVLGQTSMACSPTRS